MDILERDTTSLVKRVHGGEIAEGAEEDNGWETDEEELPKNPKSEKGIPTTDIIEADGSGRCLACQNWYLDMVQHKATFDHYCLSGTGQHEANHENDLQPPDLSKPILAISQLAKTSKALRELVLPHLFADLDLENRPNRLIRRWMDVLLARYGLLVKKVCLHYHISTLQKADQSVTILTVRYGSELVSLRIENS